MIQFIFQTAIARSVIQVPCSKTDFLTIGSKLSEKFELALKLKES